MSRLAQVCLLLVSCALGAPLLSARPDYLEVFKADKFRKAGVDGCGTCHVDPAGGGVRNPFGAAFAASNHFITPMLRAEWPDRFDVKKTQVADGLSFYFSDPEGQVVVAEVGQMKYLVNLKEGGYGAAAPAAAKAADRPEASEKKRPNNFSFFLATAAPDKGGNLGGLIGADRKCQALADAAGAGDKLWRAYLSTSYNGRPAVNAGDRIGSGPWYNKKGVMIARGVSELHSANTNLNPLTALNEKGDMPKSLNVLTGTLPDGTASVDATCENWTSNDKGSAALGLGRTSSKSNSCKPQDLQAAGAASGFYCFAAGLMPPKADGPGSGRGPALQVLSDDEGETFLNTVCTSCHNLDRVKTKKATADQWGQIVDRMRGKGITLTDEDTNSIIDYLARRYR
jgi:hypothetical protein